jgi:hypothetical protein
LGFGDLNIARRELEFKDKKYTSPKEYESRKIMRR